MKNPVYIEYKRSSLLGVLLVLTLSLVGATVHYLLTIDSKVVHSKSQLDNAVKQLDSTLLPLMGFAEALRRNAQIKLQLPAIQNDNSLPVLSVATADSEQLPLYSENAALNLELQMLLRLQPYFELAGETQPLVKGLYYFSEQGFAYNGAVKWPDYLTEQLLKWRHNTKQTLSFERDVVFYSHFSPQQAAMMVPLSYQDKKLGSFLYILATDSLLAPVHGQHPQLDFMLLDQSGELVGGAANIKRPQRADEHMLQVQRLSSTPWSLAVLEHKTNVFAAGLQTFFWHWLGYLLLLGTLLIALQWRYRKRTLSPVSRLIVHIDRLAAGQPHGVRHIPQGWAGVFDKVYQLDDRKKPDSE
jgi:hypothetical protein